MDGWNDRCIDSLTSSKAGVPDIPGAVYIRAPVGSITGSHSSGYRQAAAECDGGQQRQKVMAGSTSGIQRQQQNKVMAGSTSWTQWWRWQKTMAGGIRGTQSLRQKAKADSTSGIQGRQQWLQAGGWH